MSYKKPKFVKNREALKQIEMLTESIPQLILQIYIFQKKNDIFNVFSSSVEKDSLYLLQIVCILASSFSIIFGLIGIYGYKAFYYYEQKKILLDVEIHPEKGLFQIILRFISLFFWYSSIVISRILLIGLLLSHEPFLIILLISLIFISSLILNRFEKNYFEQKKYITEFKLERKKIKTLSERQYKQNIIGSFIYYKPKSVLKKIISVFNMIIGVYDNILIDIEYHSNTFYIPRQTKNYIIFYLLFYIENIIFAIILYFGYKNDLRIILFYVITFLISVAIQILYRKDKIEEKVSFYFYLLQKI
jgi:hypothetical protein